MRILIVSPDSDLETDAEIVASASDKQPYILNGFVTRREVLREIEAGKYYAVHFGGHGDARSLWVTDGRLGDGEMTLAFERSSRAGRPVQVVLLNSCRSISAAARLHSLGAGAPAFVIGWRHDVGDEEATIFASVFWRSLTPGADVHGVFDAAVDTLYDEFPHCEPPILINGLRAVLQEVALELRSVKEEQERSIREGQVLRPVDKLLFLALGFTILSFMAFILTQTFL